MKLIIRLFMLIMALAGCSAVNDLWPYDTWSDAHKATPNNPKENQIALLLPLNGAMGGPGRAVRDGFMASYYQSVQSGQTDLKVRVYDTSQGNINTIYQRAIQEGAGYVVGPLEKDKVQQIARLPVPVTTLALNYTTTPYRLENFYEFGLSPLDEAAQAAQFAYENGHRSAAVIAPAGAWGNGVAQAFRGELQRLGGHVTAQYFYSPSQDIGSYLRQMLQVDDSPAHEQRMKTLLGRELLPEEHRRQDIDMIFLVALPAKARQITPMLRFYYAGDLPVYSIASVYSGIPAPSFDQDLNGVSFDDIPWIFNPEATKLSRFPRLYALGNDAFMMITRAYQWKNSTDYTVEGRTGVLSMDADHRIHRKSIWAQFRDGHAEMIG